MNVLTKIRNDLIWDNNIGNAGVIVPIITDHFEEHFFFVGKNIEVDIYADRFILNGKEERWNTAIDIIQSLGIAILAEEVREANEKEAMITKCGDYIIAHPKWFPQIKGDEFAARSLAEDFVNEYGVDKAWYQICCVPDEESG